MNLSDHYDMFMPHGMCFLWLPEVMALHIISDALIALAYFSIPFAILRFVRGRDDLEPRHRKMALLFAAFIAFCGLTHVLSIYVLWVPIYIFEGWLKAITAIVSVATAISLLRLIPAALKLPSAGSMRAEIAAHKETMIALDAARAALAGRVRRSEDALRENEAKFKSVAENMSEGLVIFHEDASVVFLNPAAASLHGFEREADGMVRREDLPGQWRGFDINGSLVPFEDWPIARVIRGERFQNQYMRIERADKLVNFDAVYNGAPIYGPDGKFLQGFVTIRDVSKEVEAQRALERAHDLLRGFTDAVPGLIYAKDREGRMLFANDGTAKLIGKARSEFIGKTDAEFLGDAVQAEAVMATDRRIMDSGISEQIEEPVSLPDGTATTWLSTKVPLRNSEGLVTGLIGLSVDISARKVAEDLLIKSEERFRRLAETVTEVFTIFDTIYKRFDYVSPAWETITGRPCWELYNNPDLWGELIHSDDRNRVPKLSEMDSATPALESKYRILHKDGAFRWLHTRDFPFQSPDGQLTHVFSTSIDITQSRKVEEQLLQSQKLEAVGRLAGGVAHDFNNILTVIIGYSDILLERPDLDDDALKALRAVAGAADRASALTAQLLGFSRQTILAPQVVNLNNMVGELGGMLSRLIGEDVAYTTVLDPGLDRTLVDPGQLGQVVMNLAVNARDAMPQGGKLTVETRNVHITGDPALPDRKPGPYVMIAVTDTGTGIAPEVRARMFDPFFTTKGVGKGTGLGLSMVLGIVEQSGGFVTVYSEPDHGTTFKVFLPAVQDELAPRRAPRATGSLAGSETILLVEDEADVRDLARRSLERQGYTVLAANDGQHALQRLADTGIRIDAVLTDVVMPNMSGPDLMAALRHTMPDLPVLFMSGYTDDVVVRHGLLDAGASFIQKPFTTNELAQRLRAVLDSRTPRS